jgi:hypothetical protein
MKSTHVEDCHAASYRTRMACTTASSTLSRMYHASTQCTSACRKVPWSPLRPYCLQLLLTTLSGPRATSMACKCSSQVYHTPGLLPGMHTTLHASVCLWERGRGLRRGRERASESERTREHQTKHTQAVQVELPHNLGSSHSYRARVRVLTEVHGEPTHA